MTLNSIKNYKSAIEFIEYFCIGLDSSHNIQEAFFFATQHMSESDFQKESIEIIRYYRLGHSFNEALSIGKNSRLDIAKEIFNNIQLSSQLGNQLIEIMEKMAMEFRIKTNSYLEKLAYEAPIKMIFPLVIFIFPVLFILLGTKTLISFISSLGVQYVL